MTWRLELETSHGPDKSNPSLGSFACQNYKFNLIYSSAGYNDNATSSLRTFKHSNLRYHTNENLELRHLHTDGCTDGWIKSNGKQWSCVPSLYCRKLRKTITIRNSGHCQKAA